MGYTISEAAKIAGVSSYTLRYYDSEGLLPFVGRDQAGNRDFTESDFEWLSLIADLKKCGMSVKEIGQFINWSMDEKVSLHERLAVHERQKSNLIYQFSVMESHLKNICTIIENYQRILYEQLTSK